MARDKFDADVRRELLKHLGEGKSLAPPSWDLAVQLVLAGCAVETAYGPAVSKGPPPPGPNRWTRTRLALHELLQQLAFPLEMESPATFAWDELFDNRLGSLLLRLSGKEW